MDWTLDVLKNKNQFDLILMDCQMPNSMVMTVQKRSVREKQAQYQDVVIIAMTASAMAGDEKSV